MVEEDDNEYSEEPEEEKEETAEDLLEDDEISPLEEGFMKGYEKAGDEKYDEDDIDKEFE